MEDIKFYVNHAQIFKDEINKFAKHKNNQHIRVIDLYASVYDIKEPNIQIKTTEVVNKIYHLQKLYNNMIEQIQQLEKRDSQNYTSIVKNELTNIFNFVYEQSLALKSSINVLNILQNVDALTIYIGFINRDIETLSEENIKYIANYKQELNKIADEIIADKGIDPTTKQIIHLHIQAIITKLDNINLGNLDEIYSAIYQTIGAIAYNASDELKKENSTLKSALKKIGSFSLKVGEHVSTGILTHEAIIHLPQIFS